MGWIHYTNKAPTRERLLVGDTPRWISNSKRNKYIAQVILSCPPWVDRKALWALHEAAAAITKASGVLHVMDHIVPLTHPRVCGLSVPWNLEIVTWRVNASKGNKWNPDQMELFA